MLHVFLVDPLAHGDHHSLQTTVHHVAQIIAIADFVTARRMLLDNPPALVVSNLRLASYNGIHLALIASAVRTPCLIYARPHDVFLAREAQLAGAFYARFEQLPFLIPSFLRPVLPSRDRRDPAVIDRRTAARGGRRSTDVPSVFSALRGAAPQGGTIA
jgi:hypothetical protein